MKLKVAVTLFKLMKKDGTTFRISITYFVMYLKMRERLQNAERKNELSDQKYENSYTKGYFETNFET